MNIIILHQNHNFAVYLKKKFCEEKKDHAEITDVSVFINRLKTGSFQEEDQIRLILDAHISGNMSGCEGFEVANQIRYQYGFKYPIIIITWFTWMDDFLTNQFLQGHLAQPFVYKYLERKLPHTMILTLPLSFDEIYTQLKRY